jgi:RND superfamily putative drug exporter
VVLGASVSVKQIGLGLAVAVLIDVTVVRMVLVPAVMKLLGQANWWLPPPLARILPAIARGPRERAGGPGAELPEAAKLRSGA